MDVSVERHGKIPFMVAHYKHPEEWKIELASKCSVIVSRSYISVKYEFDEDQELDEITDELGFVHLRIVDGSGRLIHVYRTPIESLARCGRVMICS